MLLNVKCLPETLKINLLKCLMPPVDFVENSSLLFQSKLTANGNHTYLEVTFYCLALLG